MTKTILDYRNYRKWWMVVDHDQAYAVTKDPRKRGYEIQIRDTNHSLARIQVKDFGRYLVFRKKSECEKFVHGLNKKSQIQDALLGRDKPFKVVLIGEIMSEVEIREVMSS